MHRRPLLSLLDAYETRHPGEAEPVGRIRALVTGHADCFQRTCAPGHITGSAWIVSHDRRRCLLTHHKKLGRWLQLGGHADGETEIHEVALREAREESGMSAFTLVRTDGRALPFDVDVHLIPARGDEPEHEHHDIRYLLVAAPGQTARMSDESHDLRWYTDTELQQVSDEESVLRMMRKARRILGVSVGAED